MSPVKPEIIVLEEVGQDWESSEQFWIAYFKMIGARLTNLTMGGEGPLGIKVSESTRLKRSKSLKGRPSAMKGKTHTVKTISLMREAKLGKLKSDETKIKMSLAQKGRTVSAESREKISQALKIAYSKPEMFEKLSAQRKGRTAHNKGKFGPSGQKRSAETKALLSEKAKERERLKRESGFVVSDETRKKLSEANLRRYAKSKQAISA
jgi:hypothetical protein